MTPRRRTAAALAAMVCLGAIFTLGCSGDEEAAVPDAVPVLVEQPSSPLEAALGFPSDPERRRFLIIGLQRQADAAMVECMASAGFYYAPVPAEEAFFTGAFRGDGTREWTTVNGLGITSSFVRALAVDADQNLTDDTVGSVGTAPSNEDYIASLSPDQAVAYDVALIGDVDPAAATGEFAPGGCFAEAYTTVLRVLAIVTEFETQLESLNSRLNADPRFRALQGQWSTCMAAAGFRYGDENAMVDDVYARLLQLDLIEANGVTTIASASRSDELLAYEIDAALASFDCRQGFIADLETLRFDYEQEFLDDNRFRIAELEPAPA